MKKTITLLILSGLITASVSCKKSSILLPVKKKDKCGYINTSGEMIIQPHFDSCGDFYNDRAVVSVGKKYGIIDAEGKYIVNPKYDYINDEPSDNLYYFEIKSKSTDDEKYGFINGNGELINKTLYDWVRHFKGGKALVKINDKWGIIDTKGNMVLQAKYDEVSYFNNGVASVLVNAKKDQYGFTSEGKYGFINESGEYVVEPKFDQIYFPGLAKYKAELIAVNVGGAGMQSAIEIPNKGKNFEGGKWGFINIKGAEIIRPTYEHANVLSGNRGAVYKDGLWALINQNGKLITDFRYKIIRDFSEGLAPFFNGEQWGFIDENGKEVIPAKYGKVEQFSNGLAFFIEGKNISKSINEYHFERKDGSGFINKNGNIEIKIDFLANGKFINNFGKISTVGSNHWAWIDRSGKFIWKFTDSY